MPELKTGRFQACVVSLPSTGCSGSGQVSVEWTVLLMIVVASVFALGIALNSFASTTGSGFASSGIKTLGSEVVRRAATP